jgi:hypothetical protein
MTCDLSSKASSLFLFGLVIVGARARMATNPSGGKLPLPCEVLPDYQSGSTAFKLVKRITMRLHNHEER